MELDPACPPGEFVSITSTFKPSDAAYTAAASPARPAPTIITSGQDVSLSGDHRHLAGDAPCFNKSNRAFAIEPRLDDLHAPGEQHEKGDTRIARLKQDIARAHLPYAP